MSEAGAAQAGPWVEIAIAVVRRGDEVLVGRRPEGVPLAGMSEFPGGKVQPAESAADAASRECLEEAGLAVRVIGPAMSVTHEYAHGRLRLHFFDCAPLTEAAPAAPFAWTPIASLTYLEFPPANAAMLARLERSIAPR